MVAMRCDLRATNDSKRKKIASHSRKLGVRPDHPRRHIELNSAFLHFVYILDLFLLSLLTDYSRPME